MQPEDTLSLPDFLTGVGQLKFRGTSVLFRIAKAHVDNYKMNMKFNLPHETHLSSSGRFDDSLLNNSVHEETSFTSTNYELATHTIKVKRTGALVDINTLWDLEGATTPSITNKAALSYSTSAFLENNKPNFNRLPSIDCFNQVIATKIILTIF